MAEAETVRIIRIKGLPDGLDALASKLKGVESAYSDIAKQSETVAVATERAEKRQLSAAAAYNRVQRSLDDQFRALEKMGRVERNLRRAFERGLVTEHRRVELLDIRTALEAAGMIFVPENGEGAGVRLKKLQSAVNPVE